MMRRFTTLLLCAVSGAVLTAGYRASGAPVQDLRRATAAAQVARTFDGRVARIPSGTIQVVITVEDGFITLVTVPVYPDATGVSQQINQDALPTLMRATLETQSADVDTVSGATATSEGYRESLQSAIDEARR
ncbi:FMN-binding protein [Virgisporangium aliadipatigenens]|uniref:FMN-binding protein n=1 Tax=Virgisporangium aliadipatigenens TaxID=741659 RepID=A0A8J3YP44_9ACTN|nr:FMN-binding protein [Virgisporangium aliadipatigenens]GIJ48796.1 FMN-binding protein [Virgisporangium aliadipatigenens]